MSFLSVSTRFFLLKGQQDFCVRPSPLGTNWGFELIVIKRLVEAGSGGFWDYGLKI